MIVYKDRTFCSQSANCLNNLCWHRLTETDEEIAARKHLPISFVNFRRPKCGFIQGVKSNDLT